MRGSNMKYGMGILTILAVVVYFGVTGFQSARQFYLSVDEVNPAIHDGHSVKLMGRVAEGSIQWIDHKRKVRFEVEGETGGTRIPVAFDELTPDNFDAGRNVIIVGRYTGGKVTAKQVIVQCPSKYEAAEYNPQAAEAHNSATEAMRQAGKAPVTTTESAR